MAAHQQDGGPGVRPGPTPVGRSLGFERGVTAVVGVLVLLASVLVLVVGAGVLGTYRARRTVLDPIAVQWLRTNPRVAITAAIAIGLILLVLGLWWLTRALRPEPRPDVRLGGGPAGATIVTGSALTEAIRTDARSIQGVSRVRVRMAGRPRRPTLRMVLALQEGTDVREVWNTLEHSVLSRARQALETDALPTAVRLEFDKAPRQRVD